MLFRYNVVDSAGEPQSGVIEAINVDVAISSLQRRGFIISAIKPAESKSLFQGGKVNLFSRVKNKDIVILTRQVAILFEAQVSALRVFRLLAAEVENPILQKVLEEISTDLQGGNSISAALARHPKIFSEFYINMVRSGEESGKLDEVFTSLADHLDRTYEVTSKAKNALIYPSFVIFTFIVVMVLMFTVVIPKITKIITDSGQPVPVYTQIVMAVSQFMIDYGLFLVIALIIGAFFVWRYSRSDAGKNYLAQMKLSIPYVGTLYRKLYLASIAENMNTLLISGISMIRSLEITADVVGNDIYKKLLQDSVESVKAGMPVSEALSRYEEIPGIMVQMIRVGEETGQLGTILKTMAKFYGREVTNAVDTLVSLIEPVMIVVLGLGVGTLLASVLIPIYNISSGF